MAHVSAVWENAGHGEEKMKLDGWWRRIWGRRFTFESSLIDSDNTSIKNVREISLDKTEIQLSVTRLIKRGNSEKVSANNFNNAE